MSSETFLPSVRSARLANGPDGHDPARKDKDRQSVAGPGKKLLDHVARRFNVLLAGLKDSGAGPTLESRLTRSPDPTRSEQKSPYMLSKNTYRVASLAIFSAAAIFISTNAVSAATLTVINNSDSGAGSLRQAIIDSPSGDIINFASSLDGQTITLTSGELLIDKNLKIKGPGAKNLTISGNNAVRVFNVTSTGTVSFSGLTIANGYTDNGGGIYNASGTVNITNCTITNNQAVEARDLVSTSSGGGIYGDIVIVTNSTVSSNSAGNESGGGGGGIYGNTVIVHHSSVSGNVLGPPGGGGGIFGGTVTTTSSEVNYNAAANAGGIYGGLVTVTNSTVSGNSSYDSAAGIYGGTVTVTNSTVSNNSAAFLAGGIYSYGGALTVTNSTVSGNSDNQSGGGITVDGTNFANIINSAVVSNSGGSGGGIYNNYGSGTLNITNCTISGNTGYPGGGIDNNGSGTLNITNSTVSGNYANNFSYPTGDGGGIYNAGTASVNIRSSIVALNTATSFGPDVAGSFTSSGFNLIGKIDGSMGFTAPTDLTGTVASPLDPKLDPNGLQNNGGPTQTIALLSGSPAIDKGTSYGLTGHLTTDQRGTGFPRTFDYPYIKNAKGGDGTDIGAFEFRAPLTPISMSRKMHGSAGPFDIDLPFSGDDGIECRTGGATGDYEVIMSFATPVTVNGNPQAEVRQGSGQIGTGGLSNGGVVSVNGAVVTVPLTNVANAQTIRIRLNNVSDGTNRSNVSIPMGVLVGDVNATRMVDGNDVSLVQRHMGKTANGTNFRFDVDASGLIDGNDVSLVQSQVGTSLPPPH